MKKLENINYINSSWNNILHLKLYKKIVKVLNVTKIIPNIKCLLIPFSYFTLSELKIVILGQDPYPNENLATGLAFSVPKDERIPATLSNIFKEINIEYDNKYNFTNGDLTKWASREKILLLNTSLTTLKLKDEKEYNIYHKIWEIYTDIIIQEISNNTKNVCFVLFGNNAHKKRKLIDESKHYIVESIHPSPQISYNGFFNSNIFKKIESYVGSVNWQN